MKLSRSAFRWLALAALLLMVFSLAACGAKENPEAGEPAKPSNPGGPGEAVNLTGDAANGKVVFEANCVACHGAEGKVGVANPGSLDETVPSLNPIDETMKSSDAKTFVTNIDLFIEHGSTPEGDSPTLSMLKFGDDNLLKPQEIADVIAYVVSLNK